MGISDFAFSLVAGLVGTALLLFNKSIGTFLYLRKTKVDDHLLIMNHRQLVIAIGLIFTIVGVGGIAEQCIRPK